MSALLGISARTVYRRMDEFNFKKINFSDHRVCKSSVAARQKGRLHRRVYNDTNL